MLCQVKADMMMETRNIRRKAYRNVRKAVLETTAADCAKELVRWKDTKVYLYEQYKAGIITREDYIARIEKGRISVEELGRIRSETLAELDSIFQPVLNEKEIPDETLMEFSTLDTFDKDRLKVLIDKVLVYGEDSIEIVWKVDDPFKI